MISPHQQNKRKNFITIKCFKIFAKLLSLTLVASKTSLSPSVQIWLKSISCQAVSSLETVGACFTSNGSSKISKAHVASLFPSSASLFTTSVDAVPRATDWALTSESSTLNGHLPLPSTIKYVAFLVGNNLYMP